MLQKYLRKIINDDDLSQKESRELLKLMLDKNASKVLVASVLISLRMKGAVITEVSGMLDVMKKKSKSFKLGNRKAVDICGTGGDVLNTINVSTIASFITAGAGLTVVKQTNQAVSSKCGSVDLLEGLGLAVKDVAPAKMKNIVEKTGMGFLYTDLYNPTTDVFRNIAQEQGVRTIYDLLLPLASPTQLKGMVLGVHDQSLTTLAAQVLRELGVKRAFVVNGAPAIDEISIVGPTKISELVDGKVKVYMVKPRDFGLEVANIEEIIAGESVADNVAVAKKILSGKERSGRVEIVLVNAAAAIIAGGKAKTFPEAMRLAENSLYEGKALAKLQLLKSLLGKRSKKKNPKKAVLKVKKKATKCMEKVSKRKAK